MFFILINSTVWAGNDANGYIEDCGCDSGPYAVHLPNSLKDLRSIGKLKSERVLGVEDWDTYKAETRELIFEGLRLVVITFTNNKPYMIATVNITSPSWKNVSVFRVGDTVESIKKRLKRKSHIIGDWLKVGGDTDSLRFRISNGKIVEIEYQCYTG